MLDRHPAGVKSRSFLALHHPLSSCPLPPPPTTPTTHRHFTSDITLPPAAPPPGVSKELIDRIPGRQTDRKTPLGELNWVFTAITDTIAWNSLPRALFQKLFRQVRVVCVEGGGLCVLCAVCGGYSLPYGLL
jgi:hypothetical protein